ncbi:MAG: YbhB/YbcL family Raf kinase inhibitor-like protein [Mycobacteriales bacterium]
MAELKVRSDLFEEGASIPKSAAHTYAGGENISPDLSWEGVPEGTASIAVTCYDPDAPTTVGFVHWVLFNLDPATRSLPAGAGAKGKNPQGSVLGYTDWGVSEYGGMAPPPGDPPHHYQFSVYALDDKLSLDSAATYAIFRFMAREHTLAMGTLTGTYQQ